MMSPTSPLEKCPCEVWEMIFLNLQDTGIKPLLACRAACSTFKYWTDKKTSLWSRMSLDNAVRDNNLDICFRIVQNVSNKYHSDDWAVKPLHLAAYHGHFYIYHLLMSDIEDKNPVIYINKPTRLLQQSRTCWQISRLIIHSLETTWWHAIYALRYGDGKDGLEVCSLIMNSLEVIKPAGRFGYRVTPLHWAALRGHLDICQLLIENIDAKNPATNRGVTPMHLAADMGHLEICSLIIENVVDRNPADRD